MLSRQPSPGGCCISMQIPWIFCASHSNPAGDGWSSVTEGDNCRVKLRLFQSQSGPGNTKTSTPFTIMSPGAVPFPGRLLPQRCFRKRLNSNPSSVPKVLFSNHRTRAQQPQSASRWPRHVVIIPQCTWQLQRLWNQFFWLASGVWMGGQPSASLQGEGDWFAEKSFHAASFQWTFSQEMSLSFPKAPAERAAPRGCPHHQPAWLSQTLHNKWKTAACAGLFIFKARKRRAAWLSGSGSVRSSPGMDHTLPWLAATRTRCPEHILSIAFISSGRRTLSTPTGWSVWVKMLWKKLWDWTFLPLHEAEVAIYRVWSK